MILNACYIDWVVERCDKSTLKHFFWKMKFVDITLQRFYKQEANYSDGKGAWNTFASNFDISCILSNLCLSTSSLFFCFLFLHMQFVCPFFVFFLLPIYFFVCLPAVCAKKVTAASVVLAARLPPWQTAPVRLKKCRCKKSPFQTPFLIFSGKMPLKKQDKVNSADSASKSMVKLVRAEKLVLSGLVFARKIARMILIQNI